MILSPSVTLEITRRCPSRCLYCYNHWRDQPSTRPEPESLTPVIDAVLGTGRFSRVDLTGGEPMSHPDFFDIVRQVRGHGARPTVVTDGGLIGLAEAKDLARSEVALVQPTILSTDRAVHGRLKGAGEEEKSLDRTIHAIALLRREEVKVSVAFICTALNHDHLGEVLRLCHALDVESVAFSRLCTTGRALRHPELWPEPWMISSCLERLTELGSRYHLKVRSVIAVPRCVSPRGGGCSMARGTPNFTVDPWGQVRPCSVSEQVLGAISSTTADSWNEILSSYRELLRKELSQTAHLCQRCEHLIECAGGCRASAKAAEGLDPLAIGCPSGET